MSLERTSCSMLERKAAAKMLQTSAGGDIFTQCNTAATNCCTTLTSHNTMAKTKQDVATGTVMMRDGQEAGIQSAKETLDERIS